MISSDIIKDIIENDNDLLKEYKNIYEPNLFSMCPNCKHICERYNDTNEIYCYGCRQYYCFICNERHDDSYDYCVCPNKSKIKDTMAEIISALGDENVKPCPICKIIIHKEEGCSAMKCLFCRVKFCWDCLKTQSTQIFASRGLPLWD
jgi:hypothetical protein